MHHPKKWGGTLVIFWDALGMFWLTLETHQRGPRRSRMLQGALGHSGGVLEDTPGGSVDTLGMDG